MVRFVLCVVIVVSLVGFFYNASFYLFFHTEDDNIDLQRESEFLKIYQREGPMAPTSADIDAQAEDVEDLFQEQHESYNIKEFTIQYKGHDWQDSYKSLDMTPDKLKVHHMNLFNFVLQFL